MKEVIIDILIGIIMIVGGSIPLVDKSDWNQKGLSNAMYRGGGISLFISGIIYIILIFSS